MGEANPVLHPVAPGVGTRDAALQSAGLSGRAVGVRGFSVIYLGFTVYNDIGMYRAAVAEGKPAMINSVFGIALVLVGTPIYIFYRLRRGAD